MYYVLYVLILIVFCSCDTIHYCSCSEDLLAKIEQLKKEKAELVMQLAIGKEKVCVYCLVLLLAFFDSLSALS